MSQKNYISYSGYCPEFDRTQTLEIAYIEARVLGSRNPQRKVVSCDCPNSDRCSFDDDCPIFKEGSQAIYNNDRI